MRLLKEHAEVVLSAIVYFRDNGYTPSEIHAIIQDRYRKYNSIHDKGKENLCAVMSRSYNNGTKLDDDSFEKVIEYLSTALNPPEGGDRGERDLIDLIVKALQVPYAKNILRGEAIEALKRAILFPNELSALRAKLDTIGCAGCGHVFGNEEMVTIYNDGEHSGKGFYCIKCIKPMYACCDKCDEIAPLTRAQQDAIMGTPTRCKDHQVGKEEAFKDPMAPPERAAAPRNPRTARAAQPLRVNWDNITAAQPPAEPTFTTFTTANTGPIDEGDPFRMTTTLTPIDPPTPRRR